jgi:dTDP-4-dehydrorhamnose reductase
MAATGRTSMMRILLTGPTGQVGWELRRSLAPLGVVTALDRTALDLTDADGLRRVVREVRPALIVNAAAYTAVDRAESEPDLAMAVNGLAPGILAEEGKRVGAALVHFSTDYVFDGRKAGAYVEDDAPAPVNVYGATKLAGERAMEAVGAPHLILRTSWVYGARGANFFLTMRRLARERPELRIVDDQTGAPTWCRMIAEATAQIIARERPGPGRAPFT